MTSVTVPFSGPPNQRATGTTDRRYVNVLFEEVINPILKQHEVYCVKRPGLANSTRPPGANATGRGMHAWGSSGKLYSVFGNKIYRGSSDLGVTLAGSSGRVWWEETPAGVGTQLLIMSDGADNYNITLATDENYLNLPGASPDYASTPDSAALDVTGDIEIIWYAVADDVTPAAATHVLSKSDGGQNSYRVSLDPSGTLSLITSTSGSGAVSNVSNAAIPAGAGEGWWGRITLDVNDGSGNRVANFYTSTDAASTSPGSVSWIQLGTTVTTSGTTTIFAGTAVLAIGARTIGEPWDGKIYRAQVYNGIGGTLVADFDPNNGNSGAATITSAATGEVYTMNGTSSIVGASITQIDENDDADYPASNLGPIYYLNGKLFQAQSDGDIWNSDLNSYIAWSADGFLRAARRGDALEAIHLQKDQLIAFGKNSIEFYFDNGNPTGSPLLRLDQNTMDFGLAAKETLAWSGGVAIFVSENASRGDGARSVWMIQALSKVIEISNPSINRFLASEGTGISSATAWMERVAGQLIYVLNLSSANRTFIYNVDTPGWDEWEIAAGSAKFNGIAVTSLNGVVYIQDATNGRIYTMSPTTFQDSAANFTVTLQTEKNDFGSGNNKFQSEVSIVGDTTTGNLNISVSDNEGAFSTARTIDMSLADKRLTRLGSFLERSYRYTYADNYALRLQAARHNVKIGTH